MNTTGKSNESSVKQLTMVFKIGTKESNKQELGYALIADNYEIVNVSTSQLIQAIASGKVNVSNLELAGKELKSSNGAFDKYTLISPHGEIVNTPSPVVLSRLELDTGLKGYAIFNTQGVMQNVTVEQAVAMHKETPFANGKIRHLADRDIIQSINGEFRCTQMYMAQVKDAKLDLDLVFIGSAIKGDKSIKYVGVVVNSNNAAILKKVYPHLKESNEEVKNKVYSMSKDKRDKVILSMRRTSSSGFYGVVTLEAFKYLISKTDKKIDNGIGKIMVSCIDYDNSNEESMVVLSQDKKIISKQEGTQESNHMLVKYVKEVQEMLNNIEIKGSK